MSLPHFNTDCDRYHGQLIPASRMPELEQ